MFKSDPMSNISVQQSTAAPVPLIEVDKLNLKIGDSHLLGISMRPCFFRI